MQPTDGVVARIPTVRLFNVRRPPVWLLTDPFWIVSFTLDSSPGSAMPSGTFVQTPLPGNPGVSHEELLRELHFSGSAGLLFGSGSPEVHSGSAVPSSVSSTSANDRLPTALVLPVTLLMPEAVWLQAMTAPNCTRSSGTPLLLSSAESGSQ